MTYEEIIDYSTLTIPYKYKITINVNLMELIRNLEDKKIFISDLLFKFIANNIISSEKFLFISNVATELKEYLDIVKEIYNINLQKIIIDAEFDSDLEDLTIKIKAIVFADSWDSLIKVWRQTVNYLHEKYGENLLDIDIILTMNPQ